MGRRKLAGLLIWGYIGDIYRYRVGRGHIICRVSKDKERICRDLADGRSSIVGERVQSK